MRAFSVFLSSKLLRLQTTPGSSRTSCSSVCCCAKPLLPALHSQFHHERKEILEIPIQQLMVRAEMSSPPSVRAQDVTRRRRLALPGSWPVSRCWVAIVLLPFSPVALQYQCRNGAGDALGEAQTLTVRPLAPPKGLQGRHDGCVECVWTVRGQGWRWDLERCMHCAHPGLLRRLYVSRISAASSLPLAARSFL